MRVVVSLAKWDTIVQARNGFYYATAFVALSMSALVSALPQAVRELPGLWVPAIVALNLQITTFFFVAGLLLLERDEGTLSALAVSPMAPSAYLVARVATLTTLAAIETVIVVLFGFGPSGNWPAILGGILQLGTVYTTFGVAVASRFGSINTMLLPASVLVTLLLLPLLPHFGLAPRGLLVMHPTEPGLILLRAGYGTVEPGELGVAVVAGLAWGAIGFNWAHRSVLRLMRDTRATGGR